MQTFLEKLFIEPAWLVEGCPQEYNRSSFVLSGLSENAIILSGHPMLYGVLCIASNIHLSTGLLIEDVQAYWCSTQKVCSLERGHNVIDMSKLPSKDYLGNTINKSAWRVALDGLGFKTV